MLIRVRSIPEEGLDVSFSIPAAQVRAGFPKGDDAADIFERDVSCSVHLDLNRKDVFLTGGAGTSIRPVCSRCGESFDSPLEIDLSLTCSPGRPAPGADPYQESDEGLIFYNHEQLDLSEIVREQLLLALPIQYLCKPDCRGLCAGCGVNLNAESGEHTCPKKAARH